MGLRVEVQVDESLPGRFLQAVEAGLDAGADLLLDLANEHVPTEHEDLERSGRASRSGTVAAVSYDTPYAVIQHEKLDLKHDPGRTSKWLEHAVVEHGDAVIAKVGQVIADRLGS